MVRNYLIIAFRNLFRNKLFSTLNILGLAFGIASAVLIFLWVNEELAVDAFHAKGDRIYRVLENQKYSDGNIYTFNSTPGPMAPFIKERYPEIELATRITWEVNNLFLYDSRSFYERGRYVDQDFLQIFSFGLAKGDPITAMKNKNSIVISAAMAHKYFGDEDPIGKIFRVNMKDDFVVTGVLKPIPARSSFQFEYLLPFEFFFEENKSWLDDWGNNNIRTSICFREGVDIESFRGKFRHEIKGHEPETNVELMIQKFSDTYLFGEFENGQITGGRIEYVRIFFVVALFVLVIACINFTNLATAQATKRAKEVGLRKVIGANPRQLFRQFMGESFLTVIIAATIAAILVVVLIPFFNELSGKQLSVQMIDARIAAGFVAIIIFTAIIAGIYPSLFISEFRPVDVLKGQLKSGAKAIVFRKVLVVLQFSLSIFLIISTAVVFRQMNFMENRDIGFERENVFYVWMETDVRAKYDVFRDKLMTLPGIEAITASSQLPIDLGNSTSSVDWQGKDPEQRILFSNMNVDFNFIQSMKMQMAEGRAFDPSLITDSANYIVNETAAQKFGFKSETAGQELTMWGERRGKIVGVVKDFNFGSLHNPVDPLILMVSNNNYLNCLLIRAKEGQTTEALASTEKLWREFVPGYPFRYSFIDHEWKQYYQAEGQRGKIFNVLSGLSIVISCLGLFGLAAFSAERRTKELGIRKVLGASVSGLVNLMNKEFAVLVLIAACIGCPAGWYVMSLWLEEYAYHVDVGYLTLLVAALVCLGIAILTVSYHAIRVASTSPTRSLKYE